MAAPPKRQSQTPPSASTVRPSGRPSRGSTSANARRPVMAPVAASKSKASMRCVVLSTKYIRSPVGLQARPLEIVVPAMTRSSSPPATSRYSAAVPGSRRLDMVPAHRRPCGSHLQSLKRLSGRSCSTTARIRSSSRSRSASRCPAATTHPGAAARGTTALTSPPSTCVRTRAVRAAVVMARYSDRISVGQSRARHSLAGEVAIVTGGSRGIGRAIVALFAQHGASVTFCGRDEAVGRAAAWELGEEGRVAFQRADVASESDVEALVATCAERFGTPSILVNNAGVNANSDAVAMTEDEWDRFFAIDLKAAWLAAKHVLPHMQRARRGSIVNVSSLHGFATLEGFFPYAAAKSGLVGLTRSLALDYGPYGIRVNVVAPGFVRTRLVQPSIDRA